VYLIAEFQDQSKLEDAIQALKAEGLGVFDMDLFSEEPVEFRRGILDRPSRMSLVAVLGAIVTGGLATAGVYAAQHNYALHTGGMPLFSFWGSGVITYETTMMGAVLSTFGWFLWESRLLHKRDKNAPVPLVPPGSMCLRIHCADNHIAGRAERVLDHAGAVAIDRKGPRE
jgi:Protein of unknown function (DUF3341)